MDNPRCRRRLPSPELAGCLTWEALKEKAARYPHLRPCPRILGSRGTWQWIYRASCEKCGEKKETPRRGEPNRGTKKRGR